MMLVNALFAGGAVWGLVGIGIGWHLGRDVIMLDSALVALVSVLCLTWINRRV